MGIFNKKENNEYEHIYVNNILYNPKSKRIKFCDIDKAFAAVINSDRISVIRKMAEKVLNEKFPDYEIKH